MVGISNLLGQRVDAVPELAKRILRAIAVAVQPGGGHGRADRELIAAVVSKATEAFDEALQELRSRLLITATPGELELSSTALQDVVYTHMEERERQAWHGAMAVQLSLRGGDETDVATHFTGAGNPEKAYEWLERACARVLASSEPARAAALLEKTLMAARQIEGGERRVAIISLRLGEQWLRIGELEKLRGLLAEALPLARRIDHPALIARLQRLHARTLLARSEADRAMRELDEVVSTALVLKDARLYAEAHADLGEVHEARGNLDAAAECLVRALELSQKSDEQAVRDIALRVLNALGRVQIRRGDHDRAREFLEQALQLADEADDSIAAARALGNLAGVSHARGDYRGAIELAERALMRSRSCGDQMGAARQLNNLGSLGSLAGDAEGARRHFDEAYQTAQRIGWREGMASAAAGRQRVVR